MIPAQPITLAQNHDHTLYILSKIILAGHHALLCPASVAELSWACGRYFTMF